MRRTIRSVLLFCTLVLSGSGMQEDHPPKLRTEVTGVVTIRQTGLPVSRSAVTLKSGSETFTATTDGMGRFRFLDIESGPIRIAVDRARDHLPINIQTTVELGQKMKTVDVVVDRTCFVAGKIVSPDGEPIESAMVSVRSEGYVRGRKRLLGYHSARTNDQGEFRIENILPGRYYLEAEPQALKISATEKERPTPVGSSPIRTYFPGAPNQASATQLVLKTGEVRENAFLKLLTAKTVCVRSRITSPDGISVLANLKISERSFQTQSRLARGSIRTPANVEVCGIPAGSFSLSAFADDTAGRNYFGAVAFEIVEGKDVTLPDLPLTKAHQVRETVSVREANEANRTGPPLFGLSLQPVYRIGVPGEDLHIQTGPGAFRFPSVFGDEYFLDVTGLPEKYYVASVRLDGRDAYVETIVNTAGDLDLILGADGPVLSGTIIDWDGKPVPGSYVALIADPLPARFAPNHFITTTAGDAGDFRLNNMPPGSYRLLSVAGAGETEMSDLGFILQYLSKGEPIGLSPNESRTIQVNAIAP